MKKKQTVAQKILEVLGIHGGLKPKGIINLTKAKAPSVYTTLNKLRAEKKIAREEDGVYISQTQTSTNADGTPNPEYVNTVKNLKFGKGAPKRMAKVKSEATLIKELAENNGKLTSRVADLESENNRLRHLYMDKQAVVRYLEAKIEEFWGLNDYE